MKSVNTYVATRSSLLGAGARAIGILSLGFCSFVFFLTVELGDAEPRPRSFQGVS